MKHMLQQNLALCIGRAGQVVGAEHNWNLAFCASSIIDLNLFYRGGSQNFPLYTYLDTDRHDLFSKNESDKRVPNLTPKLIETLKSTFKKDPSPEQIFQYIYALLYSNTYRKKYAEFLKTDFPRVPFTKDHKLFHKLAEKGERLVELHLLKSKKLAKPISKCEGSDHLRVDKVTYNENKACVHINPEKWFTGIPSEVWEYHIGGYQVAEKWLKDRKGRELSSEEVAHYARVVTAIAETISIQETLDELFKEVEMNLLEVRL
jgi:predicted helicase